MIKTKPKNLKDWLGKSVFYAFFPDDVPENETLFKAELLECEVANAWQDAFDNFTLQLKPRKSDCCAEMRVPLDSPNLYEDEDAFKGEAELSAREVVQLGTFLLQSNIRTTLDAFLVKLDEQRIGNLKNDARHYLEEL